MLTGSAYVELFRAIALEAYWQIEGRKVSMEFYNHVDEMAARMLFVMQGFRAAELHKGPVTFNSRRG